MSKIKKAKDDAHRSFSFDSPCAEYCCTAAVAGGVAGEKLRARALCPATVLPLAATLLQQSPSSLPA